MMPTNAVAHTAEIGQETTVAPAYGAPNRNTAPTVPAPVNSGVRNRLGSDFTSDLELALPSRPPTEPSTPYSLRISTVEKVLAALESADSPVDLYAAVEALPLGVAYRLAARPPVLDTTRNKYYPRSPSETRTLPGVPVLGPGEWFAVGAGARAEGGAK